MILLGFVLSDMGAFISDLLINLKQPKNKLIALMFLGINYILSCPKCFTFWMSLIITQNIFIAAAASLIVDKLKNKITKL